MSIRVLERKMLPIEEIRAPATPARSRSTVSKRALTALARNIEAEGLLENILVSNGNGFKPTIVAGYRRYLACKMANVKQVPVTVIDVDDELDRCMAELSENMCREDLDDVDVAIALASLKKLYEEAHPGSTHGGNRRTRRRSGAVSFVEYMSGLMGFGTTKVHDLVLRARAYREHPDWAEAVKTGQMTPASVMRLWRYLNRKSPRKRAPRASTFRATEISGSNGRRITLVVVAGDGDPGKKDAMEKAIDAWWSTTTRGKREVAEDTTD